MANVRAWLFGGEGAEGTAGAGGEEGARAQLLADAEGGSSGSCSRTTPFAETRPAAAGAYLVMLAFCVSSATSGALWISFAPVASEASTAYAVSQDWINTLSMTFLALYAPGTVIAAMASRRLGLRATVCAGGVMNLLAAAARLASALALPPDGSPATSRLPFAMLLGGQSLAALAQPTFTNIPARVASTWFAGTAEATAVAAMSNGVGIVVGQVVSPLVVHASDDDAGTAVRGFLGLLGGQAVVGVVALLLVLLFFRSQPAFPPTAAEARRRAKPKEPAAYALAGLRRDVGTLLADKDYVVVLLTFGIGLGSFNALMTVVEQWVGVAGYDSDRAGMFGGLLMGCGMAGTFVAAILLDSTKQYRVVLRAWFGFAWLTCLGAVLALRPDQGALATASFCALGVGMVPLMTVCLDSTAAHTYPISEEVSSAGLMVAGQLSGIAVTYTLSALLSAHPHYEGVWSPASICFVALAGACALVAQLYRGEDKRGGAPSD